MNANTFEHDGKKFCTWCGLQITNGHASPVAAPPESTEGAKLNRHTMQLDWIAYFSGLGEDSPAMHAANMESFKAGYRTGWNRRAAACAPPRTDDPVSIPGTDRKVTQAQALEVARLLLASYVTDRARNDAYRAWLEGGDAMMPAFKAARDADNRAAMAVDDMAIRVLGLVARETRKPSEAEQA